MTKRRIIVASSILAGLLVWIVDALFDYFIFYEGSLLDLLIFDVPTHELYIRSVILFFFFIFGLICSWIVGRLEDSKAKLQEKSEQLAILNKELEAFNYSVSQDLKVPLRHIQGYCELISEQHNNELSDEARYFFSKATEAVSQMRLLVENLIRLSKAAIFEVKNEPVDLTIMAQQISRDLQAWDPGSRVRFEIGEEISGNGDETLLRIALFSLIGKAWKLGKHDEDSSIRFNFIEREKRIYVLEHSGTDIDPREYNDLFNPPHNLQWNPDEEALGLTVAARIIRRHGGEIWAEKTEDRSIGFFFTLSDKPFNPESGPSFIH